MRRFVIIGLVVLATAGIAAQDPAPETLPTNADRKLAELDAQVKALQKQLQAAKDPTPEEREAQIRKMFTDAFAVGKRQALPACKAAKGKELHVKIEAGGKVSVDCVLVL